MGIVIKYLPLVITICCTLAGAIGFGVARIRHHYGLKRDINHLKRDYQALSDNMGTLVTELERRLDADEKESAVIRGVNQLLVAQRFSSSRGED